MSACHYSVCLFCCGGTLGLLCFFFSSRRRHTRCYRDWSSDVCSSDLPDLGPALGSDWKDLDVMDVGEEWLREALALGLDRGEAGTAADGWGGAQYRAWTDGSHVAVLLETGWDTPEDA